jgi:hypothetical protein|tara:strand:+ start:18 stop:233 length:216 start_codon:yes stop_codon:yes gene_type:complete
MTFEQLVRKAQQKLWYTGGDQGYVMHEIVSQVDLFDDGCFSGPLLPQDAYFAVKAAALLNRYAAMEDLNRR